MVRDGLMMTATYKTAQFGPMWRAAQAKGLLVRADALRAGQWVLNCYDRRIKFVREHQGCHLFADVQGATVAHAGCADMLPIEESES